MQITLHHISDFLKPWSPIIGFTSALLAAFAWVQKKISKWANTLLHNHMAHMQQSLESIVSAQGQLVDAQSVQTENLQQQTVLLQEISFNLNQSKTEPRKRAKIK